MGGNDITRVLMTTDTVGGVWTYSLVLARQLAKWNVRVYLVTLGRKMSLQQKKEAATIPGISVFESDYKLEWMEEPWEDLHRAGEWLLQLEEELQPDLVHLNSYGFASLPWITPVLMVCHSCVYTWWQQVRGNGPGEEWERYFETVRNSLKSTDKLVAVSHVYAQEMAASYQIPLENIHVIYNGLDPEDYSEKTKKEYVFGMGRIWDEGKNYRIAEDIVTMVGWPIVIAGEFFDPGKKAVSGSEYDKGNGIIYTGVLSRHEAMTYLAEASVFMLPSLYEPFGLSALEAALSKCALVLSDIPTLREIWQESALYAPPANAAKWAEQINKLTGDESLRNEMARRARETAQNFTAKKMAFRYMALYKEILHSNLCSV